MRNIICLLVALVAGSTVLVADIVLAPLFRDGAVLQRDMPLRIWGRAQSGEQVQVTFGGQSGSTVADAAGNWLVVLEPVAANAESQELLVRGARRSVRVRDVLVGDLWLCSGQSNMAWTVSESDHADTDIPQADYPLIRLYQVPKKSSAQPALTVGGRWQQCSPQSVGSFSAAAYYFGRELHAELGVPVGLINSSWGATHIESWISVGALEQTSFYPQIKARWDAVVAAHPALRSKYEADLAAWRSATANSTGQKPRAPRPPAGPGDKLEPSGLYNGMVHPFVPASLRGVIWYQGETNAVRHSEYEVLFEALITDWRAAFMQPHLPFYYVQLANVVRRHDKTKEEFSFIREAQRRVGRLPATGMVVTVDIGDDRNIHPGNKRDVGKRLAAIALANIFERDVPFSGPQVETVTRQGNALRLSFSGAEELSLRTHRNSNGFELAAEDGVFFPAQAVAGKTDLVLESAQVKVPRTVRYGWGNTPPATLFNESGLPASPFVMEVGE